MAFEPQSSLVFSHGKVLVVGLGLIGGSLAAALRRTQKHQLWGYDLDQASMQQAQDQGIIDHQVMDLATTIDQMDLVVLAVPVKAMEKVLAQVAPYLNAHTVLTDVGSVKGSIIAAAYDVFVTPPPGFVPGHPIAGSERSGISAVNIDLFVDHKFIITPLTTSDPQAIEVLADMWAGIGSEILLMEVERHDEVLACLLYTSPSPRDKRQSRMPSSA